MSHGISGRLAEVVKNGRELVDEIASQADDDWIDYSDVGMYEEWLAASGDLLLAIGGPDSDPFGRFREIVNSQRNPVGVKAYVVRRVFDLMMSVLEEWSRGSVRRFEDIVAATILDDLLDRAASYKAAERKVESSALACTVLEHAVRRVAVKYDVDVSGKTVDDLMQELQQGGAFPRELSRRLGRSLATRGSVEAGNWNAVASEDLDGLIESSRTLLQDFV